MARVSSILARIASDLEQYLPEESVLAAFRSVGHQWRERQLGPVRTLHLFILQVLACNTAMAHLRHLAGEAFSLAGYCPARASAPVGIAGVAAGQFPCHACRGDEDGGE